MTRKWFLGLLGIGAAGQESVTTPITPEMVKRLQSGGSLRPKPRNGECPVCGTIAQKYDRWDTAMMPQYELVRCAHCKAAFWQDAEDAR